MAAAQSVPTAVTPVDAEPFDIPDAPDLPHCDVCRVGFLYPIAADEDATHEHQPVTKEGDAKGHDHFLASGGSITLRCFNCGTTQTQPMAPDPDELDAALAAADSEADQEARTSGA